jgi:hypothetical protein
MIAQEWDMARSTMYPARERRVGAEPAGKRGPRTKYSDAELTEKIRADLEASPFVGEGCASSSWRRRPSATDSSSFADRLTSSRDPAEQEQIKEELARLTLRSVARASIRTFLLRGQPARGRKL